MHKGLRWTLRIGLGLIGVIVVSAAATYGISQRQLGHKYDVKAHARAVTPTSVIVVNGEKLREACETDLKLGYELMKRFAHLMAKRLNAARMVAIRQYAAAY